VFEATYNFGEIYNSFKEYKMNKKLRFAYGLSFFSAVHVHPTYAAEFSVADLENFRQNAKEIMETASQETAASVAMTDRDGTIIAQADVDSGQYGKNPFQATLERSEKETKTGDPWTSRALKVSIWFTIKMFNEGSLEWLEKVQSQGEGWLVPIAEVPTQYVDKWSRLVWQDEEMRRKDEDEDYGEFNVHEIRDPLFIILICRRSALPTLIESARQMPLQQYTVKTEAQWWDLFAAN
jgi:hypothetical protein